MNEFFGVRILLKALNLLLYIWIWRDFYFLNVLLNEFVDFKIITLSYFKHGPHCCIGQSDHHGGPGQFCAQSVARRVQKWDRIDHSVANFGGNCPVDGVCGGKGENEPGNRTTLGKWYVTVLNILYQYNVSP